VTSTEIIIWWTASIAVIGAGVVSALKSGRRQTYWASLVAAGAGGVGMLYTLRVLMITTV